MSSNSPSSQKVAVSIIVACRNEEDSIGDCVRSILSQAYSPSGAFELIVADGMSTDRTRDILTRLSQGDGRLRVIDNPRRFVSSGLNSALAVAHGRVILRMDAHTAYATNYVQQCLAVLQETGADNVGGPARTQAEGYMQTAISAAYHSAFSVGGARFHDPGYEGYVDTVPYGCWPREVFERIGHFDEELVRNQDDEFNLRLIRAGGKIWQSPHIQSWYRTRASLGDLFRQYRQYGYWKVRVIKKHKLPASFRQVVPAGFLLALTLFSVVSLWWSSAMIGFVGLLSAYVFCNLTASLITAARHRWKYFLLLPLVFATYHLSYGIGFLQGLWHFVLVRQRPHESMVTLSRGSSPG